MASKFDRYVVAERRPAYRPVVAGEKKGGYSSADVNRLLLDAEQIFDTQLRKTEDQVRDLRRTLVARESELAALANLADQRGTAAETELTARARRLEEQAQGIAKLEAELKANTELLTQHKNDSADREAEQARIIADLEQMLSDMRGSRSWRLTRPLRWLSGGKGQG